MTAILPPQPAQRTLSELAPEFADVLAAVSSDIAMVIDAEGVVRHVAQGDAALAPSAQGWVGRRWVDTVTGETRRKVEQLLAEAAASGVSRRREVNHPEGAGQDVPVNYAAVRLGADGPFVAAGRDMRAVSAIQQRLVETQQDIERDYWKRRQVESRHRLLFQVATDAVLVVDAATLQVLEANRAAARWLSLRRTQLLGTALLASFDPRSHATLEALFAAARSNGRPGELRALLAGRPAALQVSATPMRGEHRAQLMVRLRADPLPGMAAGTGESLAHWVEHSADAVAVTDAQGRLLMFNSAFRGLTRIAADADLLGRTLADWLADGSPALADTLAAVQHVGIVAESRAAFGTAAGFEVVVEFAAMLLTEGEQEHIGFTLRPWHEAGTAARDAGLAAGIAWLAASIGQQDLPQLMREANELVERHLVGLALERAGGDIDSAAHSLGISAQSLELRRLRLGLLQRPRADA